MGPPPRKQEIVTQILEQRCPAEFHEWWGCLCVPYPEQQLLATFASENLAWGKGNFESEFLINLIKLMDV